ncbi:MAG: flavin-dependent monooxygenase [Proteobacteria bacterium]|nr:flavin-dependent monooxygenase [Pseudomonadota bacterium]HQR03760.1 hypothetical protein [Rhodocyclaceae bacterium]
MQTVESLTQAVEELLPVIESRRKQTREDRKVPVETVEALRKAGFFRLLQPKQFGGMEASPDVFFRLQSRIAEACMSTAWGCGIIAVHAYQVALMDRRAQRDVFGKDQDTRVSSAYAPVGKVERVEGGFMLSGRWGWSSGSAHCTWVLLGAIVPDDFANNGNSFLHGYRTFLVPQPDYVIGGNWEPMGLQGTGSYDIIIDKPVFVPDYRTHRQLDGYNCTNPGYDGDESWLYHIPWAQLFARTVCTPAIGATKCALNTFIRNLQKGGNTNDATKKPQDPDVLARIAKAANLIDEVESVLALHMKSINEQSMTLIDRVKRRYQTSLVIEKCIQAVDLLYNVSGGMSVFDSEMRQLWMDIHTARAHVANNPTAFERNYGNVLMGNPNTDTFI